MPRFLRSDVGLLVLLAILFSGVHIAISSPYGFHRDELITLDDARHLDWGFVAYPPLTPALGRVELWLFGATTMGVRVFSTLALAFAALLSGLMARDLGGSRRAQLLTAVNVAIVPIVVIQTTVLQYVSFDYLWAVLLTFCLVRLLKTGDERWWLGVGTAIGLGMMTKYTMAFFVTGLVGGLIASGLFDRNLRRQALSRWLWAGVAISLVIFIPNFIWQVDHHFISLNFLRHIHTRDVGQGRSHGFLIQQLYVCVSALLSPLVFLGLWFYFREQARKYVLLGWMFMCTMALFVAGQGRSYYMGPLYPALLAGGCVVWDRWIAGRTRSMGLALQGLTWLLVAVSMVLSFALFTPIAPVNSAAWNAALTIHDNFAEEIGWPELVATVAQVYQSIPADQRAGVGIIVGNYGEAGAVNMFGPKYGLPPVISGTNSLWYRTYPANQPQTLIAVGLGDGFRRDHFENCQLVAHNIVPYGVSNEESRDHPDIYLCHHLLQSWPDFWEDFEWFG